MANFTNSEYGKYVQLQNVSGSGDPDTAPNGGVYLFASGTIGSSKLYLQNENSATPIDIAAGFDIDSYTELDAAPHATQDEFLVSDNGTEKRVSMTNLALGVFAVASDSGDVSYGSDGELTIAAGSVEHGMLNDNIISGQGELAQGDLVAADEFMVSDGGTVKRLGADNFATDLLALSSEAALDVAADYVVFLDGGASGDTKKEQFSDVVANMAGNGLGASSGVLAVQVGTNKGLALTSDALEITSSAVAAGTPSLANDEIAFFTAYGNIRKESFSDYATNIAGDGLAASNGVLAVGVDDSSIELNSDALRVKAGGIATAMLADDAVDADKLASNAVVNASVASNAAIAATKLDFNVDLGGNITFGDQANDTVTFTGHVNVAQQLTASHARITNLDVVTVNSIAQTETTLEISDKLIVAALSASSANSDGGGLKIGGGQASNGNASILYDHANTALDFNIGGTTEVRLEDGVLRPETDSDVDLGTTGARFKDAFVDSITVTGEVDAASLDISGNADIDGTLEADAITINGATLQVVVEDHVGAMLDGTETGISVSYDSTDNNLDFVIDAAQTTITSLLATDIKIGEDDQTKIDFETADEIHFYANNSQRVAITANGLGVGAGAGAGGSSLGVDGTGNFDGGIISGQSGQGDSAGGFRVYGSAAGEEMIWSVANNNLSLKYHDGASQATIMTLGADTSSEYAIDVATGTNNINKIRAAAFVTYSDESLKSDVSSMANTALDTVMSLNGVEFTWKDSGERDFGFIAQDVQSVIPEAVHVASNGVQGVDYSRLTSVLVEAVKAQQVQIEELKALLKK